MPLGAGVLLADKLVVRREIGRGAMGTVWLAAHLTLGNEVAVKVLQPTGQQRQEYRARFEREARRVAQLDHPHVVKVFDYGVTDDGEPYLVMELLRGEDLSGRLKRERRLSPSETLTIVTQTAKALTRAHASGLVHRDIKPANLFLLDVDGEPFVKVLDFGIAKCQEPDGLAMTQAGAMMGTPRYMSPEQFNDSHAVDHRTDLWSLAVVTYRCLVGDVPFKGHDLAETMIAVQQARFSPPRSTCPELPPAIDDWFGRALSLSPESRYSSAKELADALADALRDLPATPPTFSATPPGGTAPQSSPPRESAPPPIRTVPLPICTQPIAVTTQPVVVQSAPVAVQPMDRPTRPATTPFAAPPSLLDPAVVPTATDPSVAPWSPATTPATTRSPAKIIAVVLGVLGVMAGLGTVVLVARSSNDDTEPTEASVVGAEREEPSTAAAQSSAHELVSPLDSAEPLTAASSEPTTADEPATDSASPASASVVAAPSAPSAGPTGTPVGASPSAAAWPLPTKATAPTQPSDPYSRR